MDVKPGIENRVVLVTGSSTGIGAAIASTFAGFGAKVILHGRTESETLLRRQKQIVEQGGTAKVLSCDFSVAEAVESFAEDVWLQFGDLHVLVNNAGADVLTGDPANWSAVEKLDHLYSTDCRATFQLARHLGQRMKQMAVNSRSGPGERAIVNIGWDQAYQGMAGDSGEYFSAIKGAVMSLTLSLAQSLAPEIRVNCVAPGWIQTQWGTQTSDYWNQRAISESLMNRWGNPQDVADAVLFLASDQSRFIAGQILNVNGGFRFANHPDDGQASSNP